MPKLQLKNILSKKNGTMALLVSMIEALNAGIFIEDDTGTALLGNPSHQAIHQVALKIDEEIIGWVKGDDKVGIITSLVNVLIQKEAERKKLGSEVLMLYQEVNLIFNFSEKLAQTIGQSSIAAITLDEATRLIKSEAGLLILWDEQNGGIEVPASQGMPLFNPDGLKTNIDLLLHILHSGQSDIMVDLSALKEAKVVVPEVQSLIYAALKVKHRVMGAIILATTASTQYAAADLKFLITLALRSSSAIESALLYENSLREAKEKEEAMRRIYEATNKFVPHEFIRFLGRRVITDVQLGDQVEKIVTVLFSDVRDYTTLAEQMTPEENFSFVCSFNERIGPVIRQHNGFINQYLGDAIMAIFPGKASDALGAAIAMQQTVRDLNISRALSGKPPIKIGVGMHTGPLIMGITGDHERMDATTIADTVNTASRLESLTKHYKAAILLSEASVANISAMEGFHLRHLGKVQLKGKTEPIGIYECFNSIDENDVQKRMTALPIFTSGMSDYFNKSFVAAAEKFSRVLEIHPEDTTAKMFLGRASHYISTDTDIPENWTGVEQMQSK